MKPLPHTPELLGVAERAVWFKPPSEALRDTASFIAHVLTYSVAEDVKILRRFVSLEDIRQMLDQAPPGIFDRRSWAYWNAMTGRLDAPPMPERVFAQQSGTKQDE